MATDYPTYYRLLWAPRNKPLVLAAAAAVEEETIRE